MAVYMKLGSATGDVTEAGHKQWIELIEIDWGMSRTVRSAVGIGKNRESTSADVTEVTVEKLIDSASSNIAQNAFVGEALACTLEFTRVEKGQEAVFRSIALTDAIISALINDAHGNDRPTEVLTLNFSQIAITDTEQAAAGSSVGASTVTYDLTRAQTT